MLSSCWQAIYLQTIRLLRRLPIERTQLKKREESDERTGAHRHMV